MNKEYLLDLANKYGSPLYVYDTNIIASQYKRITDAFEKVEKLQLNYAVKASYIKKQFLFKGDCDQERPN